MLVCDCLQCFIAPNDWLVFLLILVEVRRHSLARLALRTTERRVGRQDDAVLLAELLQLVLLQKRVGLDLIDRGFDLSIGQRLR